MKFEAFEVCFLGLQKEPFLRSYFRELNTFIAIEIVKKECNMLEIVQVEGFCPSKIKISQFFNEFHLKIIWTRVRSCQNDHATPLDKLREKSWSRATN